MRKEVIDHPSRVVGNESNLLLGTSPVSSWMNELKPKQIDDGLKILEHFGFDDLYDSDSMPNMNSIRRIHSFDK